MLCNVEKFDFPHMLCNVEKIDFPHMLCNIEKFDFPHMLCNIEKIDFPHITRCVMSNSDRHVLREGNCIKKNDFFHLGKK